MKTMMMATSAVLLSAGIAVSQGTDTQALANQLLAQYQSDGFTYVEVERGPTQIKVEGIRNGLETETIYDAATGNVLRTETDRADRDEIGVTGFEMSSRSTDFLTANGAERRDDDSDDDDDRYDDDDHDDDNDRDDDDDDRDDDDNDRDDDDDNDGDDD